MVVGWRVCVQLVDVKDDGFLSLLDEDGDMREDLPLPPDAELAAQIKKDFESGAELLVTVMGACGTEQIITSRVTVAAAK